MPNIGDRLVYHDAERSMSFPGVVVATSTTLNQALVQDGLVPAITDPARVHLVYWAPLWTPAIAATDVPEGTGPGTWAAVT